MARSRTIPQRHGAKPTWLALLAMLCQLLAPAVYAPHRAALAQELAQASGHRHHGGDGPATPVDGGASCLVHMALQAAGSGLAPPPAPIPLRLTALPGATLHLIAATASTDPEWRPQASRAPPRSSEFMSS
jgi:hypothetical protein